MIQVFKKGVNLMLLKRFAALLWVLILVLNMSACSSNETANSSSEPQQITGSKEEYVDSSSNDSSDILSSAESSVTESNTDTSSVNSDKTNSSHQEENNNNSSQNSSSTVSDTVTDSSGKNESTDDSTPEFLEPNCDHSSGDPYANVSKTQFYANYTKSCCNLDASYRSKHGLLSGSLDVPGQYAKDASYQPKSSGKYIRNTATVYVDNGNTYVVMNANGNEVMRIHKSGGYITLEEVAAYMYAFGGDGTIPANYISKKKGKPNSSIWGEYLRVNHSYFIGDTDKYPYEPELPDISGCGGKLQYYEMDIGTTGTTTPGYPPEPYIEGNSINRGAARIVYARCDLNNNGKYETNELYVFYTHNHYNDFREYLNYYGGWGEMFGNVTGGGEYSSETRANPTPYVKTAYDDFTQ